MSAVWLRLWHDMPTDPKFRVIARKSSRPLSEVLCVFMLMMTNASANATERGELENWNDEDAAAALDLETCSVTAVREAMQGKTLDGNKLTGWEKRQPKREDGSADRAKEWRERKRTQSNAEKRPDKDKDTDKKDPPKPPTGADDTPSNVIAVTDWNTAFQSTDAGPHVGVIRNPDRSITLVNGTRTRWLAEFGGDAKRLDLALIEIAGQVNDGSRKPLTADVEGRLARIASDKLDRDRRYHAAVKSKAPPPAAKAYLNRF